jgi:hypothetical protein
VKARQSYLLYACTVLVLLLSLVPGCSDSSEPKKSNTPPTVFDQSSPDPRSNERKIADFIIQLEMKYKREAIRNPIDLHFTANGPDRIKVKLTYDRTSDPTTAGSIADAAIELARRLKREDPNLRDVDIGFDREIVRREP